MDFQKADCRDTRLREADFQNADLSEINFQYSDAHHVDFREATLEDADLHGARFARGDFRNGILHDVDCRDADFFRADFENAELQRANLSSADFGKTNLQDADLQVTDFSGTLLKNTDLSSADLRHADLSGADLQEATLEDISIDGSTACSRLYEGYSDDAILTRLSFWERVHQTVQGSKFSSLEWDSTARAYHNLKTAFHDHGLVGKARTMHVRERRARSLEARAAEGRLAPRYLKSLPSRIFTGYGVKVRNLVFWMVTLFSISTMTYIVSGVEDTWMLNVAYSVLAFTVAPPGIPNPVEFTTITRVVMMFETFFGTLSIVLLGYILGNREQF